jgi:hypothetical protein
VGVKVPKRALSWLCKKTASKRKKEKSWYREEKGGKGTPE